MAAGVGLGQQWLTARFRPCDEVRPLCLTPLPPALPCLLPSRSVPRVFLWLNEWIVVGRRRGLNKAALIVTVIPLGHHSAETLPSFLSPLTLSALLICHCPTLFIQQSVLFYSYLPGPVCIWWICRVVRPQLRCLANQSLLTSLPCPSFKMNKQKQWGQLSLDLFLAMGNFRHFKSLNWTLWGIVPVHRRAVKRGRM